MKIFTTSFYCFLVCSLLGVFTTFSQSVATYTITFTSHWNATDHGTLPGNAHWSDLVGATHNASVVFWEEGALASAGMEDVAEIGNNVNFNAEVNTAISNSTADQWLQQAFDAPNNATSGATLMNIQVSENFPLLTLASMIAPSPDWFIGIDSYSLLDGSNQWKDNISIDLFPYDAGTEDGDAYSTSNAASNPQVPIFDRSSMTPFTGPKIGTLSITLESVLNTDEVQFENGITMHPNPASNYLKIRTHQDDRITSVTLFDVLGKNVLNIQPSRASQLDYIDISVLKAGLYLVRIINDSGQAIVKKLMVR